MIGSRGSRYLCTSRTHLPVNQVPRSHSWLGALALASLLLFHASSSSTHTQDQLDPLLLVFSPSSLPFVSLLLLPPFLFSSNTNIFTLSPHQHLYPSSLNPLYSIYTISPHHLDTWRPLSLPRECPSHSWLGDMVSFTFPLIVSFHLFNLSSLFFSSSVLSPSSQPVVTHTCPQPPSPQGRQGQGRSRGAPGSCSRSERSRTNSRSAAA